MTTARGALVAGLLAVLVACAGGDGADGQSTDPLTLRIEVASKVVGFGQAFPLVVRRTWASGLQPGAFDDGALAPLVLRALGSEQRRRGDRLEEVRHYDAYAFTAGKVTVPAVVCGAVPPGGGAAVTASSAPFELEVTAIEFAGAVELPPDLLPLPASPWRLAWLLLLVPGLVAVWWWRGRRSRPEPVVVASAPIGPPPDAIALQRLQQLDAEDVPDAAALQAFYVEATAAVRDYAASRWQVAAREMTSEELLGATAALASVQGGAHDALRQFLLQADLVKFAAFAADRAARRTALGHAAAFVTATAAEPVATAASVRTRP